MCYSSIINSGGYCNQKEVTHVDVILSTIWLMFEIGGLLYCRWSQIATQLPGRTDNEIKNFWNSCIKKKLRNIGIDPNTHKLMNNTTTVDSTLLLQQQQQQQQESSTSGSGMNNIITLHKLDRHFMQLASNSVPPLITAGDHHNGASTGFVRFNFGSNTHPAAAGSSRSSHNLQLPSSYNMQEGVMYNPTRVTGNSSHHHHHHQPGAVVPLANRKFPDFRSSTTTAEAAANCNINAGVYQDQIQHQQLGSPLPTDNFLERLVMRGQHTTQLGSNMHQQLRHNQLPPAPGDHRSNSGQQLQSSENLIKSEPSTSVPAAFNPAFWLLQAAAAAAAAAGHGGAAIAKSPPPPPPPPGSESACETHEQRFNNFSQQLPEIEMRLGTFAPGSGRPAAASHEEQTNFYPASNFGSISHHVQQDRGDLTSITANLHKAEELLEQAAAGRQQASAASSAVNMDLEYQYPSFHHLSDIHHQLPLGAYDHRSQAYSQQPWDHHQQQNQQSCGASSTSTSTASSTEISKPQGNNCSSTTTTDAAAATSTATTTGLVMFMDSTSNLGGHLWVATGPTNSSHQKHIHQDSIPADTQVTDHSGGFNSSPEDSEGDDAVMKWCDLVPNANDQVHPHPPPPHHHHELQLQHVEDYHRRPQYRESQVTSCTQNSSHQIQNFGNMTPVNWQVQVQSVATGAQADQMYVDHREDHSHTPCMSPELQRMAAVLDQI